MPKSDEVEEVATRKERWLQLDGIASLLLPNRKASLFDGHALPQPAKGSSSAVRKQPSLTSGADGDMICLFSIAVCTTRRWRMSLQANKNIGLLGAAHADSLTAICHDQWMRCTSALGHRLRLFHQNERYRHRTTLVHNKCLPLVSEKAGRPHRWRNRQGWDEQRHEVYTCTPHATWRRDAAEKAKAKVGSQGR